MSMTITMTNMKIFVLYDVVGTFTYYCIIVTTCTTFSYPIFSIAFQILSKLTMTNTKIFILYDVVCTFTYFCIICDHLHRYMFLLIFDNLNINNWDHKCVTL